MKRFLKGLATALVMVSLGSAGAMEASDQEQITVPDKINKLEAEKATLEAKRDSLRNNLKGLENCLVDAPWEDPEVAEKEPWKSHMEQQAAKTEQCNALYGPIDKLCTEIRALKKQLLEKQLLEASNQPDTGSLKKQIVIQEIRNFPSDAHAKDCQKLLEKANYDIPGIQIDFTCAYKGLRGEGDQAVKEACLAQIKKLFDGATANGYPERKVIGCLLENSGGNYLWQELTDSQERIDLLERFMLLNAKVIFYRDLYEKTMSSDHMQNRQSNNAFIDSLYETVGLLYEKIPKKVNVFINLFYEMGSLLPKHVPIIRQFILQAAEDALGKANELFKANNLPLV